MSLRGMRWGTRLPLALLPPFSAHSSRPGCPQPVTTHGRGPRAGPFPLDPRPPSQPLGSGTAPPVRGLPSAAWWSGVLPSRPLLLPYAVHHRSHAASPRPHASSLRSRGRAHNKPLANFPLASVSWRTQTDKCSRLYIQRKWGGGEKGNASSCTVTRPWAGTLTRPANALSNPPLSPF